MTGARAALVCTVCTLVVFCGGQSTPAAAPAASPAAAAAPSPAPAGSSVENRPLDPFTRVALCAPFTVLVEPSAAYQLTIDAEDAVRSAITTLVDGGTLLLESTSFSSTKPINVTVGLPASQLAAVTARGTFPAIVAPGFTSSKLSLNAQGTSVLSVLGVSVGVLDVSNTGTGTTVVSGNITNASIKSSGTGDVYLSGVTASVLVTSSGTGSIRINSANGSASITGASTGLGKVYFDKGTCQVSSNTPSWVFGPTCQQGQVTLPDTSASWTCGIQVTGRSACTGGSANVRTVTNCQPSPIVLPNAVSSYSLIDSKTGTLLGLDTNTVPQSSGAAGGTTLNAVTSVNGISNGGNNTGTASTTSGQGNGVGSVGAGNGNNNGNNNLAGQNGNNDGVGSVGNGNGSGNGNGNTNSG